MNGNTFRGKAYGFALDTLMKLKDLRANDNDVGATTLLHYLCWLSKDQNLQFVDFLEQIPHAEPAARISFATVTSGSKSLRHSVGQMQKLLQDTTTEPYATKLAPFVQSADQLVKRIESVVAHCEAQIKGLLEWLGEDLSTSIYVKAPEELWSMVAALHGQITVCRHK